MREGNRLLNSIYIACSDAWLADGRGLTVPLVYGDAAEAYP